MLMYYSIVNTAYTDNMGTRRSDIPGGSRVQIKEVNEKSDGYIIQFLIAQSFICLN